MQNEIYDEKNGLTYMLCGDYYLPKLALTDIEPTYGKYGMLRKSYLQEHRKAKYEKLQNHSVKGRRYRPGNS